MDIKGDEIMPLNFKGPNADMGSPGWAAVQIPIIDFFSCAVEQQMQPKYISTCHI